MTKKFKEKWKEVMVDLNYRGELLTTLNDNFPNKSFITKELSRFYPNIPKTTLINRLNNLTKNKWLKKSCTGKKNCKQYQLNQNRANKYLEDFGSFTTGPMTKIKEPETKIVKEIQTYTREVVDII